MSLPWDPWARIEGATLAVTTSLGLGAIVGSATQVASVRSLPVPVALYLLNVQR